MLDSPGCALGAVEGEPVRMLREQIDELGGEERYRRAADTREPATEVLGMRVPGEGDDARTRDDIRADMERVRELMADPEALEGDG